MEQYMAEERRNREQGQMVMELLMSLLATRMQLPVVVPRLQLAPCAAFHACGITS